MNDEDFSWEDEEESSSAPSSPTDTLRDRAAETSAKESTPVAKTAHLTASASTSPPQSEASYDIVSGHVSNASESAPAAKVQAKAGAASGKDEDEDEEEEDDDEEEEEESEESDWE